MTDSELISKIGSTLYGERWQGDLARALGVKDRTVRYWVAGQGAIKQGVWDEIVALLSNKAADAQTALELIKTLRPSEPKT